MLQIFLFSFISTCFLASIGSFISFKEQVSGTIDHYTKKIIYGIVLISFISLACNFFTALTPEINSLIFLIIAILTILNKKTKKIIFNFKILLPAIVVSILCTLLVYKSKTYTPDAALYHLNYTGLINSEKIIIGIANLHHRFGFISIMQYTSAIFNNIIFSDNGIVLPSAILAGSVIANFYSNFYLYIKKKQVSNIHFIYLFCVIIFVSIKMTRYSDYGNDAPGHFIFFFLISEILKEKFSKIDFDKIYLLTVFILLNKISFILVCILPIIQVIKNKKIKIKATTILTSLLIIFWLVKNFLVTGCLIYPIEKTCYSKINWSTNNNLTINTNQVLVETEAWAKGYPDQKIYNQKDFIKDFNWIKTWGTKHFFVIINKVFPFILVLLISYFFLRKGNDSNPPKNEIILKPLLIFFAASILLWFLKSPVYRFGYSSIILMIVILYINIMKKFFIPTEKNIKFFYTTMLLLAVFVTLKQMPRILLTENSDAWPNLYYKSEYEKIEIDNNTILISSSCFYVKKPCTYYRDLKNKVYIKNIYSYKVISSKIFTNEVN